MKPEIKEELDKIDNLKGNYDELVAAYTEAYYAKENVKDAELKIKEGIAQHKQMYKKDGTTLDLAGVKMNSLNGAMSVFYGGEDKLGAIADLQDEYISDIKNGDISQREIEGLEMKRSTAKESTGAAKDTKEELKTHIAPEIVEAIDMLAKEEVKMLKESEDAEKGIDPKPKKDNSETYDILKEIKAKLGIL